MTLAAVLFLGAVLIGAFMPKVLRRFESTTLAPAAILAAWIGSIAGLGFFAVSAVAILLWPSHAPAEGLSEALVRCFTAFQHAMAPGSGSARCRRSCGYRAHRRSQLVLGSSAT
ncbi:hypothetical protein GCM10020255_017370 [Rhodococcus baikonurensis]